MAGGAGRIIDGGGASPSVARVTGGAVHVRVTAAAAPAMSDVNIVQVSGAAVGGSVPINDAAGSITVDQATHDNLNCNANVQWNDADVTLLNPLPVIAFCDLQAQTGPPIMVTGNTLPSVVSGQPVDLAGAGSDNLLPPAFERKDALAALPGHIVDGEYSYGRVDSQGALWVRNSQTVTVTGAVTVSGTVAATQSGVWTVTSNVASVNPGTSATSLGKAEDAAHSSGATGVMSLAVRNDTLSALAGTNGDYIPFTTDSKGRLYVIEAGMSTVVLSGSTRGRPIQITGNASGSAVTLHTATTTAGELDRVFVWLTNTSTASVTVTIEFGTTGVGNELDVIVPANETVLAVNGAVIGGAATDTIKAYASTINVVNAFGRVERLS